MTTRARWFGMPPDDQVPAEVAAQASPQGPLPTLEAWLDAVRVDRRWDSAMALMTPELRLTCAQAFIHDAAAVGCSIESAAAAALAGCDYSDPAFEDFSNAWQYAMDKSFQGWPQAVGFGSQPRPVDLDHEVIIAWPYEDVAGPSRHFDGYREAKRLDGAPPARQMGFLVRRVPEAPSGWLVAGWNYDRQPRPGWPPRI